MTDALDCIAHPSPNHGPRKGEGAVDMIILHYTAMETGPALERLCDPEWEVSCHYLICPQGQIFQLVPEDRRAWHAGRARWGDVRDVNSRSIGIELANLGDHPFAHRQMEALIALVGDIRARHSIPPERVLAHSDIAPDRKTDPGARFDWGRLVRAGHAIALRAEPRSMDEEAFGAALARAGYDPEQSMACLLAAFRLRHRPGAAAGPLDAMDMGLAHELASRFPFSAAD
ncbi:N-acetylmuramoyl-L-alanine amidase [Rubricella aquisinus]|uniref:N-acetylmuramoyl-L-alanine amidase n=1 Tax=Rubricella aquisinus TaxID=2028108 RepID=A0A840WML1_9RHOB|nr:N-acetylmuramoyl-L-alanine amidase [Rubricella aquisinus]MBB5515343.1 N-acetylmuramoyl-L-alanine amidase [Rubricella aquisinus]